jgi:hypothetical protein
MTRKKWKSLVTAALCAVFFGRAWPQEPRVATLDIAWENAVVYIDDLADPAKLVASPNPVTPNVRNFMTFMAIGDIVSVNNKPATGF